MTLPAPPVLERYVPETDREDDFDDEDDYEDFEDLEELDATTDEPYDETYDFEDSYGPLNRFLDFIDMIGWRVIAAAGVIVLLLLGGIGAAMVMHGRQASPQVAAQSTPAVAEPKAEEPQAAATPVQRQPAPAASAPAAAPAPVATPAGGLALESLVLFDGRDPSVFQSAPENPVSFQGDAEGGFARVSSSTGATGARIEVGRGVYQRIAGHRIRIVLVARAARTAPATGLRFAYQNGRVQSPWTDVPVGPTYTPLSAVWTAPPERGGPENDSLIIEPGVPGDGTAVDIRSARIEILN